MDDFRLPVTPLSLVYSCSQGESENVRELVRRGVSVNVLYAGKTPLYMACYGGHIEIVRFLIDKGANVNACENEDKWTPLHVLMHAKNHENDRAIIDILLLHGADIDARNQGEQTPLHHACEEAPVESAAYLVARGANVHARDIRGNTPLHLACSIGELDMVRMLLEKGVNIHLLNNEAKTPLECVCSFDDEQENRDTITRMLLLRGAVPVDIGRCPIIQREMRTIRRAIVTGPQQTRDSAPIGAPLHTDEMFRRIMEYVYGRNA